MQNVWLCVRHSLCAHADVCVLPSAHLVSMAQHFFLNVVTQNVFCDAVASGSY